MTKSISIPEMRAFLSKSIRSSSNNNKLHGLLAEVDFRNYVGDLGFEARVSVGGWVLRTTGPTEFARSHIAIFPEIISPGMDLSDAGRAPSPENRLHAVCSTLRASGIQSYYCIPSIVSDGLAGSVSWRALQLGGPEIDPPDDIRAVFGRIGFRRRSSVRPRGV